MSASGRARATALGLLALLGCTERTTLTALPDDIEWVVVARRSPATGERISALLRVTDGALALAADPDETFDLWGYGAELAPLLAGVDSAVLAAQPLRDASACESTLPAARWSTHLSAARALPHPPDSRSFTADWLAQQCPRVDPGALRASVDCALRSCGAVRVSGCRVEVDLVGCGHGVLSGQIQADGRVCLVPPAPGALGTCTPRSDPERGLLAGLVCDERGARLCAIDLYDSPSSEPLDLDPIVVADPAPDDVGPDDNDFGIDSRALRRMNAIPWGDGQLLVTAIPWGARPGCRDGNPATVTRWSVVDAHHLSIVGSGTTTPCIRELARSAESEAIALAVVGPDDWVLVRLDAQARELQRYALAEQVRLHGTPQAMALTDDGEVVVLYLSGGIADAFHRYVRHDPRTLAPVWTSGAEDGISTFMRVRGRVAWASEVSGRSIETMDLDSGIRRRPYTIPDLPREPLEVGGLLLPEPERGRELIAIVLHDMPGLLVTSGGTTHLTWYAPFHRDDAYPTALGMYRGEPVVTLLSRDPARRYRADLVAVDPVARRWKPGVSPLGVRVVSAMVDDSHGRTWVIAPWEGSIARLP